MHEVINARGHVVVRNEIQHILVYLSEENRQQWLAIINTEGARIKLRTANSSRPILKLSTMSNKI